MENSNMNNGNVNNETDQAIDEEMQKSYHNVIRQMITSENEIRNQRTNWFLVIQGFLVAGCCELYANKSLDEIFFILFIISTIGIITSCSFLHAAWRSEKSIEMALACWDIFLEKYGLTTRNFPPVILLTERIIRNGGFQNPDDDENIKYEKKIFRKIYEQNNGKSCKDGKYNKRDYIMPFKAIPKLFLFLWSFVDILLILSKLILLRVINVPDIQIINHFY